jgi:hypothetical protein
MICHYGIQGKPSLLGCSEIDQELAELLAEPFLLRSREGGRSIWRDADHLAKAKLLFLASLKGQYDDPFIRDAPLSVEFFDRWWSIQKYETLSDQQDVLDNLSPAVIHQLVPTGLPLVDDAIRHWGRREPRTDFPVEAKYRVWWEGDVIGRIEEPQWDLPSLQGQWSPTVNPRGKAFAAAAVDGVVYPVVIDGSSHLHGEMVKQGGRVTVTVRFASAGK